MAGQYYWEKEVKEYLDSLPRGQKSSTLNEAVRRQMYLEKNPEPKRDIILPEVSIIE